MNERNLVNSFVEKGLQDYMNNLPTSAASAPSQPATNSWESGYIKEGQGTILISPFSSKATLYLDLSVRVLVTEWENFSCY